MSAWGPAPFENDDAVNWSAVLVRANDTGPLETALQAAVTDRDINAHTAARALAAAAVVAAMLGNPSPDMPQAAQTWATKHRRLARPDLVRMSLEAVDNVLRDSELAELWEDSGQGVSWQAAIDQLVGRLRG